MSIFGKLHGFNQLINNVKFVYVLIAILPILISGCVTQNVPQNPFKQFVQIHRDSFDFKPVYSPSTVTIQQSQNTTDEHVAMNEAG